MAYALIGDIDVHLVAQDRLANKIIFGSEAVVVPDKEVSDDYRVADRFQGG